MNRLEGRRNSSSGGKRHRAAAAGAPIPAGDLELLEVTYSGVDAAQYASLRAAGISHSDTMEAHALGADLEAYRFLRSAYDHASAVVEAGATGTSIHQEAVRLGVTADELGELRSSYRAMVEQFWLAIATASVVNDPPRPVPPMTTDYLTARRIGLPHGAALDFACRLAVFTSRHDGLRLSAAEVDLWARCRFRGLNSSMVVTVRPRLDVSQLSVLHACLFFLASQEAVDRIGHAELIWLASRSKNREVNTDGYLTARLAGRPRRLAYLRFAKRQRQ